MAWIFVEAQTAPDGSTVTLWRDLPNYRITQGEDWLGGKQWPDLHYSDANAAEFHFSRLCKEVRK